MFSIQIQYCVKYGLQDTYIHPSALMIKAILGLNGELTVISHAVSWAKLLYITPVWLDCYTG